MKRIAALVLAMILLAAQSASACAAVRPLRFLVNDNGEVSAWLKEHAPDIPHENLHFDYDYSPGDFDSLTETACWTSCKAGTAPTCTCWRAAPTTWPGCWRADLWMI